MVHTKEFINAVANPLYEKKDRRHAIKRTNIKKMTNNNNNNKQKQRRTSAPDMGQNYAKTFHKIKQNIKT